MVPSVAPRKRGGGMSQREGGGEGLPKEEANKTKEEGRRPKRVSKEKVFEQEIEGVARSYVLSFPGRG